MKRDSVKDPSESSNLQKQIYISSISYAVGETKSISDLEELQSNNKLLDTMLKLGINNYCDSNLHSTQLASTVIADSLLKSKIKADEIGAVIYCSDSVSSKLSDYTKEMMYTNGLDNAFLIGVRLSDCSNFITGLRTACSYLNCENIENILVVVSDTFIEQDTDSRLVYPTLGVFSDGAASCILSTSQSEIELCNIVQKWDWSTHCLVEDELELINSMSKGIKNLSDQLRTELDDKPQQTELITNNYNEFALRSLAELSGFYPSPICTTNINKYGHVFSADGLINLLQLFELEKFSSSAKNVVLLGNSTSIWSGALIKIHPSIIGEQG